MCVDKVWTTFCIASSHLSSYLQVFIRRNHVRIYIKKRVHSLRLSPHSFVISYKYITDLCKIGMSSII